MAHECIQKLRSDFEQLGIRCRRRFEPRARGRARAGWPTRSGAIGEAWSAKNSGDQSCEVFISPVLKDPLEVAATLVHELVHCAVGVEEGHKGKFPRLAKAVGLEGKMTATHAGETLKARLREMTDAIGPYPHAELTHSNARRTRLRLLKVACECGCVVRMTRKWLDEVGPPTCGCGARWWRTRAMATTSETLNNGRTEPKGHRCWRTCLQVRRREDPASRHLDSEKAAVRRRLQEDGPESPSPA